MKPHGWFICGALLAAMAVANGAFAAHGLRDRLTERYAEAGLDDPLLIDVRMQEYETGVRYQQLHAVALILLGLAAVRRPSPLWLLAGFGFLAGIILFSGMLYLLVLTNRPRLGMFVPLGGAAMIVGWLALAAGGYGALREERSAPQPH